MIKKARFIAPPLNDSLWRKAESNMARRERNRLIRLGRIVPAFRMKPTPLFKDESGNWSTF